MPPGGGDMRRRTFCAGGLAALGAASIPFHRALAADGGADIPAVGLDGRELTLKSADIQDLRAGLRGELITVAHPDYASARRLWNPAFDRHPSLIVRCAAAAEWRRASATENADLFWALRGGGGNFGVVTSFTFRLHEVTPVMYGGNLQFPITGGREMLRSLGDIIAAAPDELYVDVAMGTAPENVRWLAFNVCYCGPSGEAERVVGPLRKLGKPREDTLAATPYDQLQGSGDLRGLSPLGAYGKGGLVYGITPALVDVMVGATESAPSDGLVMWLQHQGGAISRVPPKASAYFNRGASHNVGVFDSWQMSAADVERRTEWVRHTWTQIEPLTRGQYVNLAATDDRETRVHAAYGDNYPRLAALKKRYDPNNLFRLNANIKPA